MPEIDLFAEETGDSVITLTKKDKQRVVYLERVLKHLSQQHGEGVPTTHPDSGDVVSDTEFDKMWAELEKLDPAAIKRIGVASAAPLDPNAKKMKHDPPMTSIKKANGTLAERQKAFEDWLTLIGKELKLTRDEVLKMLVCSYKHDGAACSLKYVNGDLVQAGLRPHDGVWGEDVTENVKYVKDIPQKLPLPLNVVIRGELECRISTFNKLNGSSAVDGQEFANPRNYTTGSIRQYKDPTITRSRQLSFVAYRIIGLNPMPAKTERELAIWCNKTLKIPYVRTESWTPSTFEELESKVPDLDYEVDGVVVSVNSLELQEQLGTYGNDATSNPRGKLAWKFADDTADPLIEDIVWETGRTGDVTPVAHFKGVKLAGTTVVKATAFSVGFLLRNNIRKGGKIRIRKSGKIIPEVLGYFEGKTFIEKIEAGDPRLPKAFDFSTIDYPKTCPSCDKPTEIVAGGEHGMFTLLCKNPDCPAQNIKRFTNYLEKMNVKGLGEATITQIVESGLVKRFSDFYTLSVKELHKKADRSIRQSLLDVARLHMIDAPEQIKDNQQLAKKTVDAIKRKKHVSLSTFIAALGIPGAGKGTGSSLALHFRNLKAILNAKIEDLEKCSDVGKKTAQVVYDYIQENRADIEALASDYLDIESPKSGKYTNQTFVFTGGWPEGKEYWKDLVEQEGGIVKGSVSKTTNYVVIGTDPGEKADKARALIAEGHPIKIIDSHSELSKMFS